MYKTLIVEDEPRMRLGLWKIIGWENYGFKVCGDAENGSRALDLIELEKPELVLTDIRLPGIDGLELMKQVSARMDTNFIVISGYDQFDYVKTALVCGAADYLLKPVEEDQLIGALHRVKKRLLKQQGISIPESDLIPADPVGFIKDYVSTHYREPMTIKEIAGKMYLHPFYIGQLFRKSTGMYFNDYVHQIRVEAAKRLLTTNCCKISEIAESVGYHDSDYFVKQFKKIAGCTPSVFRHNSAI